MVVLCSAVSAVHIQRRGTVFLVVESPDTSGESERIVVSGVWDGWPDAAADGLIEELSYGLTVEAAVEWGRQRSDRVLIRNDDPSFKLPTGRYFWGGLGPCPPQLKPLP